MKISGEHEGARARHVHGALVADLFELEVNPTLRVRFALRPAVQIASNVREALIGQQVNSAAEGLTFDAFIDRLHQAFQTAEPIAFGEAADLSFDGGLGLLFHVGGGGQVDEAK